MNKLFRDEAVEAHNNRLSGSVVLALPIQLHLYVISLLLIAALFGTVLIYGTYTRRETVRGMIMPKTGLTRMFARAHGQVEQIHVELGQFVKAGTPLIIVREDHAIKSGHLFSAAALEALDAETREIEQHLLAVRELALAERHALREKSARLSDEHSLILRQLALQEERIALAEAILNDISKLAAQGLASLVTKREREAEVFALRQGKEEMHLRAGRLAGEISEIKAQLLASEAREKAAIAELNAKLANQTQRRAEIEGRSRYSLTAPVDGVIAALAVRAGDHVRADSALLAIAAPDAPLIAELLIPSRAAGFLKTGQEVRLHYDAFPYLRFGAGKGIIREISQAATPPEQFAAFVQAEEPVFLARVDLAEGSVPAYGERHALHPGMTLSAVIVLDRQPLWRIVFDPLRAAIGEGGLL